MLNAIAISKLNLIRIIRAINPHINLLQAEQLLQMFNEAHGIKNLLYDEHDLINLCTFIGKIDRELEFTLTNDLVWKFKKVATLEEIRNL